MKRFAHIRILILLLIAGVSAMGQMSSYENAVRFQRDKNTDSARIFIDSAALNTETKNLSEVWFLRGYVYKDLSKQKESANPASPFREIAADSYIRAWKLDSLGNSQQHSNLVQSIKYLASQFHNDITKTIDTVNHLQSLKNADRYVQLMKLIEPGFSEKDNYSRIFLSMGSSFEEAYLQKNAKGYFDLAKVYLFKAYDLNPNSFSANKNIGLLYYNNAVRVIEEMDATGTSLERLDVLQNTSISLAKQALPYLLKSFELDPFDKESVEGITGCYYLLNEIEQYNVYKKKLDELKNK